MSIETKIEEAVRYTVDSIDLNNIRCIFLGESHGRIREQSAFRRYTVRLAEELLSHGFQCLFLEWNSKADADFQKYLRKGITLSRYKAKWVKKNTFMRFFKNQFYYSLRKYQEAGGTVRLINKTEDPGRDAHMAEFINEFLRNDKHRGIYFCGALHAFRRQPGVLRDGWETCAERVEGQFSGATYSVLEFSRFLLLDGHRECVARNLDGIEGSQIGVSITNKTDLFGKCVVCEVRIGSGHHIAEAPPQEIICRARDFDAVLVDSTRYLDLKKESELMGQRLSDL